MEGGLPQLNTEWFSSQLFWFGVTFIVLYITVARYLVPRIHDVLETRQERIDHDLDWASSLRTEAEEAREHYESALTDARKQAQTLLNDVSEQIRVTAETRSQQLSEELKSTLEQAEKEISQSVAKTQANLAPIVTEVSSLVIEKMLNEKPDTKRFEAILEKLHKEKAL